MDASMWIKVCGERAIIAKAPANWNIYNLIVEMKEHKQNADSNLNANENLLIMLKMNGIEAFITSDRAFFFLSSLRCLCQALRCFETFRSTYAPEKTLWQNRWNCNENCNLFWPKTGKQCRNECNRKRFDQEESSLAKSSICFYRYCLCVWQVIIWLNQFEITKW